MTPTLQWLNDNWFQIVGPFLIVVGAGIGGVWLRRIVFDAIAQSGFKRTWRPAGLVLRVLWQPFLQWAIILGAFIAVNLSTLTPQVINVLNRVLVSFLLLSLAWLAIGIAVGLFLYYEIEFRKSLNNVKAPQPPRTVLVNGIRAIVALVTALLLLKVWQGPDVSGLLAFTAFAIIGGLALHDAVEATVSGRARCWLAPLRSRRFQKTLLSVAGVTLFLDIVRRLVLLPGEPSMQQNAAILWLVLEVAALIWAGALLRQRRYSHTRPRFAAVAVCLAAVIFVPTLMGIEPVSSYVNMVVGEMENDLGRLAWQAKLAQTAEATTGTLAQRVKPAVVVVVGEESLGSGMVIDKGGRVLTCWHVVEGHENLRVILQDRYYYDCVVGPCDEAADLALLIPDRTVSTPDYVELGSIADVEPGDDLWVVGYALGLEGEASVTKGVASAVRDIDGVTYLQTDAPMNPGNSGGPVVDSRGCVVAVASWKILKVSDVSVEGVQFGVAIDHAGALINSVERSVLPAGQAGNDEMPIERQVVACANAEREARGTPPVLWDDDLAAIASKHAAQMAARGEMFHSSVTEAHAENCWMGAAGFFDAEAIVQSWMDSELHRTWLLCPSLKRVAVGMASDGHNVYATWTFWRHETRDSDWWYGSNMPKPEWWY